MNIPTAEELHREFMNKSNWSIEELMIEFAKPHVEAALKAAHRNFQAPKEDLEFTMNSYPLENIK